MKTISSTTSVMRCVALMCALTLAGCATGTAPLTAPPSRADDEKSGFTVHDTVGVGVEVREDFETAMTYLNAGKYEEGTKLLTQVTQRSPRHIAPYINLAIAYQKMDKLPAAEESIKKALALDPAHPVANTEYGLIYRKTGRFTEARQAYERVLQRHKGFLPARKNLGILCDVYLRDLECALEHYRAYAAAVVDDKAVQIWIADLETRLGKQ